MWRFHEKSLKVTWLCLPSLQLRANATENRSGLKRNFIFQAPFLGGRLRERMCCWQGEVTYQVWEIDFGWPKVTKNNSTRWATPKLVASGVISCNSHLEWGLQLQSPIYFRPLTGARWQGLRVEADDVGYSCAIASCRDSWEMAMAPRSWRFTKNFEWWIYDLFWQKNNWKTHFNSILCLMIFLQPGKTLETFFFGEGGGEGVQLCFVSAWNPKTCQGVFYLI